MICHPSLICICVTSPVNGWVSKAFIFSIVHHNFDKLCEVEVPIVVYVATVDHLLSLIDSDRVSKSLEPRTKVMSRNLTITVYIKHIEDLYKLFLRIHFLLELFHHEYKELFKFNLTISIYIDHLDHLFYFL